MCGRVYWLTLLPSLTTTIATLVFLSWAGEVLPTDVRVLRDHVNFVDPTETQPILSAAVQPPPKGVMSPMAAAGGTRKGPAKVYPSEASAKRTKYGEDPGKAQPSEMSETPVAGDQ